MVDIIPYVEIDGAWTANDGVLKEIYIKLFNDGTLNNVFYDADMAQDDFIAYMKRPGTVPSIVMNDNKICGIVWLNSIMKNHAFGHFAFFKEVWGETEEMGQKVLDYWMSFPDGKGGKLFDVILGLVPKFNEKAMNYILRIGMKPVGTIPSICDVHGEKQAGYLYYYAR